MRNRVYVVVGFGIALYLAEIIAPAVILIERNSQSPDITLPDANNGLLTQRLGPAIKTAWLVTKRKIRSIGFSKTQHLSRRLFHQLAQFRLGHVLLDANLAARFDFRPRVNTTRRNMPPRNLHCRASVGYRVRQKRVP